MLGIQICHYLAKGLSIKEVAAHLNITWYKLDGRLRNLRRHYNCTTTYELMGLLGARGELAFDESRLGSVGPDKVDQD